MAAYYHLWHHPDLDGKAAFDTIDLDIPTTDHSSTETKTFQSLRNDMEQLRSDGATKGIVDDTVVDVGTSSEGHELWALKVGKGADHKVLFTGCHHAREWISVEVPYLVAKFLIDTYDKDKTDDAKVKRVKHLLDNREIWFVPMVNPDGHNYSVLMDRLWRPNRKEYVYPKDKVITAPHVNGSRRTIHIKAGAYRGVDINRNYPSKNWGKEADSTSQDPLDSAWGTWTGPSAGSESETQAIVDLMVAQNFRSSITYHSYSQLLLYPSPAKKDAFIQFVGKGMSKLIDANGNPYKYQASDDLYPTTGTTMDYALEASPGRPTYTPELRPRSDGPDSHAFSGLPEAQIEPTFQENLNAALALINCAGFDAPANGVTITWKADTKIAQVVRNCWKVFEGFKP